MIFPREMNPTFEILDISGDAGLRLRAADMKALLEVAALGLAELVTDPALLREDRSERVSVTADDDGALLVEWLNELVFLLDARGFIAARAEVAMTGPHGVEAVVRGEAFDPLRHERRLLVKAATYHGLSVRNTDDGAIMAEVVLDI